MKTKTGVIKFYSLVCWSLLAAITSSTAAAEPLTLTQDEAKGYRAGKDPIRIAVGNDMPKDLIPYLRFEIDSIDVTDFIVKEPRSFTFTPQEPLTGGIHELRVVAVLPNGTIEETAVWKFEVRASVKYRVAEVNKKANLVLMQRLATNLPDPQPSATQAQGVVEFSSTHANGGWTLTSKANALYNSQVSQNPSGESVEVPDYQVKADWTRKSLVLGQQVISPGSLVLNEFSRRGISYSQQSEHNRLALTGFATRTAEVTGSSHITGLDDANNLASGVILSGHPFKDKPQALDVSLVYLDSRGATQGSAQVNDVSTGAGGNAHAVIVDSYHGNNTWQVRGEYAATAYDFDGLNTGYAAQTDNAYTALINYDTSRDTSGKDRQGRNWTFGIQRQRIGPWFFSQGNTNLTPDRDMTQMNGGYQGKEFGFNGLVSFGEDNVVGDNTLPITALNAAMLGAVYTPMQKSAEQQNAAGENKPGGIFQNPSFSATLQHNHMNMRYSPAVFTGDKVNMTHQEATLAVTSAGTDWNWTLSHALIQQNDLNSTANNSQTVSAGLDASFTLNQKAALAPVLQQSVTRYTSTGVETQNSLAGATLNLSPAKNWATTLSYTVNRARATDGTMDTTTQIAQALLQFTPTRAGAGKFGVSYFTTASYQESQSIDETTGSYQLFVGASIAWPASN